MNDVLKATDRGAGVAVFGASDAEPGSQLWERARALGSRIARRGAPVITGGYGGVMEAACQAAREAGGEAVGVTCRVFRGRSPNAFLSLEIEEDDLLARTDRIFSLSRGFIVLAGGVGTLAELSLLWAHARAGVIFGPIVLWDETWARLADQLAAQGRLEGPARRATRTAHGDEEAVLLALSPLA